VPLVNPAMVLLLLLSCHPQGPVPPPWRASLAEAERSALASIITQLAARAQFSKDPSGWWGVIWASQPVTAEAHTRTWVNLLIVDPPIPIAPVQWTTFPDIHQWHQHLLCMFTTLLQALPPPRVELWAGLPTWHLPQSCPWHSHASAPHSTVPMQHSSWWVLPQVPTGTTPWSTTRTCMKAQW
jgi:hypothetical protein